MNLVLINTPIYDKDNFVNESEYLPPLGLGYIANEVRKKGINVTLIDAMLHGMSIEKILENLHQIEADHICLNIFSPNIILVKKLIEGINSACEITIGGIVTNSIYEEILSWNVSKRINIVIGEGDYIVSDIIFNNVKEIPVFSNNSGVVYKVDAESCYFPKDLDTLDVYWDLFDRKFIKNNYNGNEISIVTSRGCIYDCTFCGAAKSRNSSTPVRTMSPLKVTEVIYNLLQDNKEVNYLRILDDLFLKNEISVRTAIEIFNSFDIKWRAMAHIMTFNNIDDTLLKDLRKSGCVELFIGIETGSERVRNLINKYGSSDLVILQITRLLKVGINVKGYFIYGFPTETKEEMEETYQLAAKIRENSRMLKGSFRTSVFQYRPYHGTQLFDKYIDKKNNVSYVENKKLTNMIDRSQFNCYSINCSEVNEKVVNEYIIKTMNI